MKLRRKSDGEDKGEIVGKKWRWYLKPVTYINKTLNKAKINEI